MDFVDAFACPVDHWQDMTSGAKVILRPRRYSKCTGLTYTIMHQTLSSPGRLVRKTGGLDALFVTIIPLPEVTVPAIGYLHLEHLHPHLFD